MNEASLPAAQTDDSAMASAPRNVAWSSMAAPVPRSHKAMRSVTLGADLGSAVEGTSEGR